MSIELYYFSGTGNSLYVARELQKRIHDAKLIPIVHLLQQDVVKTNEEIVGLVFPNFCLTIPIPIHEFLKKMDLGSASYIFAVCTRGGSTSQAFDYINSIIKKQGKKLSAQLNITMPWNLPVGGENLPGLNGKDRIDHLESILQVKLQEFSRFVEEKSEYIRKDTDADYNLSSGISLFDLLVPKSFNYFSHKYMYQVLVHFYSDAKCNGCGICEKVCLSKKIEIIDSKPVWKEDVDCYACFACMNFCPQQAIQVLSKFPIQSSSEKNARYHHHSVTYKDIAEQR